MKHKISCLHYIKDVMGKKVVNGRTSSLEPGSTNMTSLKVDHDSWVDFKTGDWGDVIALIAAHRFGGDNSQAYKQYLEMTGQEVKPPQDTDSMQRDIARWHMSMPESGREYLRSRGFTDETINLLKIGYNNNRIIIPCWRNGRVHGHIGRAVNNQTPKYLYSKGNSVPFGFKPPQADPLPIVLCEGTLDSLTFIQEGYESYAGHNIYSMAKLHDKIVLAFDNDEAGQKFLAKAIKYCIDKDFEVWHSPDCKDINEHYMKHGSLKGLKKKNGLRHIIENVKDYIDAENIINEGGLRYAPDIMARFLSMCKQKGIDTKGLDRKPTQHEIATEVLKSHNISYQDQVGFYEYSCGCWRERRKNDIEAYVYDVLSESVTATMLRNVVTVIQSMTPSYSVFNKKEIFVFQNGTLCLESGDFLPHDESDMSSFQADYSYTPDCGVERTDWERFVYDVAGDADDKYSLLQQIAGYCLFSDCRLEKAFYFIGSGANGKSVFTKCLSDAIGDKNVSMVNPDRFKNEFEPLRLKSSMLNLATEAPSSVSSSMFKKLVSGEKISAAKKGKDAIEFTPRCKHILNMNSFMLSNDTTDGFLRRLCIVKFNEKYIDACDAGTGDKIKEIGLERKLAKKPNEIFNWMYDGYRKLKEAGSFIVLEEQKELMDDFTSVNDPIKNFAESLKAKRRSAFDLYVDYKAWCDNNGEKPLSNRFFSVQFKQIWTFKKERDGNFYYRKGD